MHTYICIYILAVIKKSNREVEYKKYKNIKNSAKCNEESQVRVTEESIEGGERGECFS